MECPACKSENFVRQGFRKNVSGKKQKYQCLSCAKYFIKNDGFQRMRNRSVVIARAIHMHQDGMSFFAVQNHLWQHDNTKISRQTLWKWEKKYSVFLKSAKLRSKANYQRKNTHG